MDITRWLCGRCKWKPGILSSSEENRYADEQQLKFLDNIDTILLGRKTYELFVDYWPTATTDKEIIADKLNLIPKMYSPTP